MSTIMIAIGAFFLGMLISLSPCSANANIVMGIHFKQPNTLKHTLLAALSLTYLITLILDFFIYLFSLHELSSLFMALIISSIVTVPKLKIATSRIIQPIKRRQLTSNTPLFIRLILATIYHPCSLPGFYTLSNLAHHSMNTTTALISAIGLITPCLYFKRHPQQPKLNALTILVDLISHACIIICMIIYIHHHLFDQMNEWFSNILLYSVLSMLIYRCYSQKTVIKALILDAT